MPRSLRVDSGGGRCRVRGGNGEQGAMLWPLAPRDVDQHGVRLVADDLLDLPSAGSAVANRIRGA